MKNTSSAWNTDTLQWDKYVIILEFKKIQENK